MCGLSSVARPSYHPIALVASSPFPPSPVPVTSHFSILPSVLRVRWLFATALAPARADSTAVLAVVQRLFDGMRARDTSSMRALFVPQARMLGLSQQGELRADPIDGWLAGIARAPEGTVYDERTWAHEVRVDGDIAQAWMQYAFFVGDRLNHCGVDAFDLVRMRGEWRIVAVMDTRRSTGCAPPAR
jgi:hypothetical protein